MLVRLVINKRLCYGYSVLPILFDKSFVVIAPQWTVAAHGESEAEGRSVEEHNQSNVSSKRITNKEVQS